VSRFCVGKLCARQPWNIRNFSADESIAICSPSGIYRVDVPIGEQRSGGLLPVVRYWEARQGEKESKLIQDRVAGASSAIKKTAKFATFRRFLFHVWDAPSSQMLYEKKQKIQLCHPPVVS